MDFPLIVSFLKSSQTGSALIDCASRTRTRFGLRGGVVRNLLLDKPDLHRDLFDAIDPFSDFDIVVDDSRNGRRLLQTIFATVPFAGFYRWEVMARDSVVAWLRTRPHFATDEFVIWIDGTSESTVTVSRLIEPGGLVLEDTLKLPERLKRFTELPLGDLLVSYVKLLTILSRREYETSGGDLVPAFQQIVKSRVGNKEVLNEGAKLRLHLQLAKLFGASFDLGRETASLKILSEFSALQGMASDLLSTVAGLDRSSTAAIGVWRSEGQLQFKFLNTEGQYRSPARGGFEIPPFTIPSPPPGCCPYTDFRQGPAVVMWRGPSPYRPSLEDAVLFAYEAPSPDGDLESAELYPEEDASSGIQIPNVLSIGRGLIARLDHAFLGALLGRSALMQVTVAEVG